MLDTSAEAARVQADVHRRMGPVARFRAACQMSDAFRRTALRRIAEKHPDFSDADCRAELVFELHGIRIGR